MKIFEGKSPAERNKTIAALVLGVMAVLALGYTFIIPMLFSGKKTSVTVKTSPSPTPTVKAASQNPNMPSQQQMDFEYTTVPVIYTPTAFNAPGPGRNIFAFYEPGKPTPYSPTPTPPPTPFPTPTATPPPPIYLSYANPQSVYAGSKGFRLELAGDKFTPDSVILFSGSQLPTTYGSPQNLSAQIPESLITFPGTRNITVITPDGKLFSNMLTLNVQEPPKPAFKYIGMIARKRANNDTAYFEEPGKENQSPTGARLNDVVAGRFRLKSISAEEVLFEDINLGFKHRLPLTRPNPGDTGAVSSPGFGNTRRGIIPGNQNMTNPNPVNPIQQGDCPPGIPCNIPRYIPTPRPTPPPDSKQDVDDEDGEDTRP